MLVPVRRSGIDKDPLSATGRSRRAVLWVGLIALLFLAGTYLVPLLETAGLPGAGPLRLLYAPLCHQQPARSFTIGEGHQAVCSRCAGLYGGGVAGLLAAVWLLIGRNREPRPIWLAFALAPTMIDALAGWVGLPALSELPRHLLAWPPGFVAGLFLAMGISDTASYFQERQSTRGSKASSSSIVEGLNG